jgi:serine protease Do/serine protease DegQ
MNMLHKSVRIPIWAFVLGGLISVAIGSDVKNEPSFRMVVPGDAEIVVGETNGVRGVVVTDVRCGALHLGDVISSVNGSPVRSRGDLERIVAQVARGENVNVEVIRNGIGETVIFQPRVVPKSPNIYGLTVADTNTAQGVIITDVDLGSRAAAIGLQPDDVILTVNSRPVHNVMEFRSYLSELFGIDTSFTVRRNGEINVFVISAR